MAAPHLHLSPDAIYPFDARGIAKRFRHAAIFGALDALRGGETMRFANDHERRSGQRRVSPARARRRGDRLPRELIRPWVHLTPGEPHWLHTQRDSSALVTIALGAPS